MRRSQGKKAWPEGLQGELSAAMAVLDALGLEVWHHTFYITMIMNSLSLFHHRVITHLSPLFGDS